MAAMPRWCNLVACTPSCTGSRPAPTARQGVLWGGRYGTRLVRCRRGPLWGKRRELCPAADPVLHFRNRLGRVQHADLEAVHLLLAGLQEAQGGTRAIVGAPATEAIGWLDTGYIGALTELLPLPEPGQLVGPLLDVQTEAAASIDQRRNGPAVGIGERPVDQHRRLRVRSGRPVVGVVGERSRAVVGDGLDLL